MFLSPQKLQPVLAILCILLASVCQADVNTVARNNNYNYKRQQQQPQRYTLVRTPQRLQRVQAAPTPYPASGYRPDRTFALPANQGGQINAAQPAPTQITRPDQLYAAPAARLRQPAPAPAPAPARQTTTFFPAPQLAYAAPARIQQQAVFAAPQQAYIAPAAQPARILQQQQQQQQQQPSVFYAAPQQQYGTPRAEAPKPAETEELAPVPAATPARLVNAAKPARLTATREDREDDADDTQQQAVDIDADEPANNQSPKAAVAQPQPEPQPQPQLPAGATIAYFPTNAYNFVQPFAVQQPAVAGKVYAPQPAAPLIAAAPLATSQQFVAQPQYYASPQFAAFTAAASPYQLQAW